MVHMDEATLPSDLRMELKSLHPHLDAQKVAAVFNQNQLFDPANKNRTFTILRNEITRRDLEVLARGCLGVPESAPADIHNQVMALCVAFARIQEDDSLSFLMRTSISMRCASIFTAPVASDTTWQLDRLNFCTR